MPCIYRSWNNKIGCPDGYRCSKDGLCKLRRKYGGGGGKYGPDDYDRDYRYSYELPYSCDSDYHCNENFPGNPFRCSHWNGECVLKGSYRKYVD